MFKWNVVANLTTSLGYTASSLGNHEFDDGVADLEAFTDAIQTAYPLLACNVDLSQVSGNLAGKIKSHILVQVGGETVGIIGYVTPDTKELSDTGNVQFFDEITSIRQVVAKLKSQGVKIIIALGHSGYDKDLEIAKEVSVIFF
jgi:2',3'-cyclic-nucleotide 2'-phosphodiesterase (5'-nucleotidase family)